MPRPSPFSISIPKPCQASWNEMAIQSGGRFCEQCQSQVRDFTGMTDLEILKVYANATQPVCGRFRASQLDRPMEVLPAARPTTWPRLLTGALLLMSATGPHFLLSQSPAVPASRQSIELRAKPDEVPASVRERACDDLWLDIQVLDARTKQPIPFASIDIPSIGLHARTDQSGGFQIGLNPIAVDSTLEVIIQAREYESTSFVAIFEGSKFVIQQEVHLRMERIEMGGPMGPPLTHKTWRLLSKKDREYLESEGIHRPKKTKVDKADPLRKDIRRYERESFKKFKELHSRRTL